LPLTKTQRERVGSETLGLNARRHPLVTYRRALRDLGAVPSERITHLPHVARVRAAGLIECLQGPATKSGKPAWFLLLEDERGYLQATILCAVYVEYGELLHHGAAVVLEGRVEQDRRWGFSFLVERVADLLEVLAGAKTSSPKAATAPRMFLTAKSHSRRAG